MLQFGLAPFGVRLEKLDEEAPEILDGILDRRSGVVDPAAAGQFKHRGEALRGFVLLGSADVDFDFHDSLRVAWQNARVNAVVRIT